MSRPNELQPADLGEILFAAAVAQGRADALKAAAKKAAKELAHPDPVITRMLASFARQSEISSRDRVEFADERSQAEIDAEMNAVMNAQEAMAINAGRY